MTIANPSINPANYDTLAGTFREVFKKLMQSIDNVLPAKIVSYNRTLRKAQVQLMVAILTTDGQIIPRAQILNIDVVRTGGGGFVIDFKYGAGDTGWLIACDRDISFYMQTLQISKPNTNRIKNFSDSFFIPDVLLPYVIASEDANNMVIQSLDGTMKIALGVDQIKLTAPTVTIESTNIALNASSNIIATTPLFAVSGNITAGGSITPDTPPP